MWGKQRKPWRGWPHSQLVLLMEEGAAPVAGASGPWPTEVLAAVQILTQGPILPSSQEGENIAPPQQALHVSRISVSEVQDVH